MSVCSTYNLNSSVKSKRVQLFCFTTKIVFIVKSSNTLFKRMTDSTLGSFKRLKRKRVHYMQKFT